MGKTSVDVVIKAHDQASGVIRGIDGAAAKFSRTITRMVGAAAGAITLHKLWDFGAESLRAFQESERAGRHLYKSLELIGKGGPAAVESMEEFTEGIKGMTTYSDEATQSAMALGVNIARISGKQLQQATVAAIGLSKAYKLDLDTSMKMVSKAAIGQATGLNKVGITLDENATAQEKYNSLIAMGIEKFKLAQVELDGVDGKLEQQKNRWNDLKESMGGYIADMQNKLIPTLNDVMGMMESKSYSKWWISGMKGLKADFLVRINDLFNFRADKEGRRERTYTFEELEAGKDFKKADQEFKEKVKKFLQARSASKKAVQDAMTAPPAEVKAATEAKKEIRVEQTLRAFESRFLQNAPGTKHNPNQYLEQLTKMLLEQARKQYGTGEKMLQETRRLVKELSNGSAKPAKLAG